MGVLGRITFWIRVAPRWEATRPTRVDLATAALPGRVDGGTSARYRAACASERRGSRSAAGCGGAPCPLDCRVHLDVARDVVPRARPVSGRVIMVEALRTASRCAGGRAGPGCWRSGRPPRRQGSAQAHLASVGPATRRPDSARAGSRKTVVAAPPGRGGTHKIGSRSRWSYAPLQGSRRIDRWERRHVPLLGCRVEGGRDWPLHPRWRGLEGSIDL